MDISFARCVEMALANPDFIAQWARLRNIQMPRNGLERAIDAATGRDHEIAKLFLSDVYDVIYLRLLPGQES